MPIYACRLTAAQKFSGRQDTASLEHLLTAKRPAGRSAGKLSSWRISRRSVGDEKPGAFVKKCCQFSPHGDLSLLYDFFTIKLPPLYQFSTIKLSLFMSLFFFSKTVNLHIIFKFLHVSFQFYGKNVDTYCANFFVEISSVPI